MIQSPPTTGYGHVLAALLGSTLFFATGAQAAAPAECGDIDGNGTVVALDALMVLRKAVGLPGDYTCLATGGTTSTTHPVHEDCFSDLDCEGSPLGPHCCAYECGECDNDTHCQQGEYCSSNCECVPGS